MNIIKRAGLWLITKKENEVSEPIADSTVVAADPATVTADTATATTSPAAEVKAGVRTLKQRSHL